MSLSVSRIVTAAPRSSCCKDQRLATTICAPLRPVWTSSPSQRLARWTSAMICSSGIGKMVFSSSCETRPTASFLVPPHSLGGMIAQDKQRGYANGRQTHECPAERIGGIDVSVLQHIAQDRQSSACGSGDEDATRREETASDEHDDDVEHRNRHAVRRHRVEDEYRGGENSGRNEHKGWSRYTRT